MYNSIPISQHEYELTISSPWYTCCLFIILYKSIYYAHVSPFWMWILWDIPGRHGDSLSIILHNPLVWVIQILKTTLWWVESLLSPVGAPSAPQHMSKYTLGLEKTIILPENVVTTQRPLQILSIELSIAGLVVLHICLF